MLNTNELKIGGSQNLTCEFHSTIKNKLFTNETIAKTIKNKLLCNRLI